MKPQQRTSELTGQHPRISVSTSHTSVQSHCDRPSNFVPGPLSYAPVHSTGNVQSCVREHGHAMHGSFVLRLRSPCVVARQLFRHLRRVLTRGRCRRVKGWRWSSDRCGGKEEVRKGVDVAESGGYQERLECTRLGVVETNRLANIPVEADSRHVGQ
jgi:hypothetical protein